LTNIAKHARATNCRVYLQRLPTTVLVTIEDDGAGFDEAEVARAGARAGLGLIGIRERAKHLRGTVRLESTPGKGTRLTVELPTGPWERKGGDQFGPDDLHSPATAALNV
jgi:signal transduction histidine kinase